MSIVKTTDKKAASNFNDTVKNAIISNMEVVLTSISASEDMKVALEQLKDCDIAQVIKCQTNLSGYVNSLITVLTADAYKESVEATLRSKDFSKYGM